MDSLNDYFISSPVSTFITCLFGICLAFLSSNLGRRVFKQDSPLADAMNYLGILAVLSWISWVICMWGMAQVFVFKLLFWSVVVASAVLFAQRRAINKWTLHGIGEYFIPQTSVSGPFRWFMWLALAGYAVLSLSVPTDADSLNYHLALPVDILHRGSLLFDPGNLHFRLAGFGEMINLIGVANGCPQLGAYLQFVAFLLFLRGIVHDVLPENGLFFVALFLGMPTLLFLIPGQKHQLTGILATTLCFCVLLKGFKNRATRMMWILVLLFAMGIKYSFFISGGILLILSFWKNRGDSATSRFMAAAFFVSAVIILGPLLVFKWQHFGDPLSPLFEGLKPQPDPVVLRFYDYLSHYRESLYPFPISLAFTSSPGRVSTILGLTTFTLLLIPFYFRRFPAETTAVTTLTFAILTVGQPTSRFLMEPVCWSIPLFILGCQRYHSFGVAGILAKVQFFVMIPLVGAGCYLLGPSLVADRYRDSILLRAAHGFAEAQWLNKVLPRPAKIADIHRSRAFLPREYFPWETIAFADKTDPKAVALLMGKLKKNEVHYLVLPYHGMEDVKKSLGARLFVGPHTLQIARRNPFRNSSYMVAVYTF